MINYKINLNCYIVVKKIKTQQKEKKDMDTTK